ncbi:MAG: peptidylprolyl isomerase [Ignavibacteria bacterium]|nr:peptidylprolyl isomerase [Ignavibacteria bacterium]
MKIKLSLVLAIYLFHSASMIAQVVDKPLVKIGNYKLSEKEYIERVEMTPLLGRKLKGENRKVKEDFLYSLIGEKLLAIGARDYGIDTLELVKHSLIEFEKMFVRDALYKRKIVEPSRADGEELFDRYLFSPSIVFTTFIHANTKKEIDDIYNLLKLGTPFDSLYVELADAKTDTLTFGIGNLPESDEVKLFGVGLNEFTEPIQLDDKWFLFNIKKKYDPVFAKSAGWEVEFKRLKKVAEGRAEDKYYRDFTKSFFANKIVQANGKMLHFLAAHIENVLKKKYEKVNPKPDKLTLELIDLLQIEDKISPDTLNQPYIQLEQKNHSLKDFIRFFRFEQFSLSTIDYQSIVTLLNNKTKKYIEWELLAHEGYRLNLDKTEEVKYQTNMWRENYLFSLMRNKFMDSTSANSADYQKYYEENYRSKKIPSQVNILEILTDSLNNVYFILDEIEKGVDFKELASKYSNREWTKSSQGEFGFFPITNHGDIGTIASRMEIGEIYGPLKVKEGYSIFKLVGKKEEIEQITPFEKVQSEIEQVVKFKKINDAISSYTASKAVELGVEIDSDYFEQLKISNINALVFKHLGFGGKVTAVPLLTPFFEWATPWLENQNVNP